jgi:hypothetical protein
MKFIKIGPMYFNIERVTEIRDTGVDLELFFGPDRPAVLRGAEADRLRRWLDSNSTDLNEPRPG